MFSTNIKEASYKLPFFYSYFISDPIEFGQEPDVFKRNIFKTLENKDIDFCCFRDKISKDKETFLEIFIEIANNFNKKVLINQDIQLAIKYNTFGIHLTSNQFDQITYCKNKGFFTIISCHNEEEIIRAKNLQADAITYSPIFYKENKGSPKGIENLLKVSQKYQSKKFFIFALGGITSLKHIESIKATNCAGFASIRYFKI